MTERQHSQSIVDQLYATKNSLQSELAVLRAMFTELPGGTLTNNLEACNDLVGAIAAISSNIRVAERMLR